MSSGPVDAYASLPGGGGPGGPGGGAGRSPSSAARPSSRPSLPSRDGHDHSLEDTLSDSDSDDDEDEDEDDDADGAGQNGRAVGEGGPPKHGGPNGKQKENGVARKQNVACDACRSRKVKCTRTNGSDKCDSCVQKAIVCTAHYVNRLGKEKRKLGPNSPVRRSPSQGGPRSESVEMQQQQQQHKRIKRVDGHNGSGPLLNMNPSQPLFTHQPHSTVQQHQQQRPISSHHNPPPLQHHPQHPYPPQPQPPFQQYASGPKYPPPHATLLPPPPPQAYSPPSFPPSMTSLLLYLFSPMEVTGMELGYSDREAVDREGKKHQAFGGIPTRAHRSLSEESYRMELANDLIETYFQIVHIRMPLLSPTLFRSQFRSPSPLGQPPHVTVAVVLAWGAKFSEHPIIAMDREETSAGMERGRSRSRLVRLLVVRAQEVLEANRAFRIPKVENLQAALLIEGLLGHVYSLPNTPPGSDFPLSKGFWTTTAVRHLLELQANKFKTIVAITDEQERGSIVFAWWLAALSDAHGAVYYRRMPHLTDEDYDIEPPGVWDGEHTIQQTPHPLGTLSEYMIWYIAAHSLARTARRFCRDLWTPEKEANGVPIATLRPLIDLLSVWRDEHLSKVGVPSVWPATWDFVAAVTACASDSNYHVMWLILERAINDFDIRESRQSREGSAPHEPEADLIRERISQEALHAALRISALASVLTTNGYLRLDPNFLRFSVFEAGLLLGKLGRPEVEPCVAGLRQYGMTFEECYDEADIIMRIYDDARKRQSGYGPDPRLPSVGGGMLGGPPPPSLAEGDNGAAAAAGVLYNGHQQQQQQQQPPLQQQRHPIPFSRPQMSPPQHQPPHLQQSPHAQAPLHAAPAQYNPPPHNTSPFPHPPPESTLSNGFPRLGGPPPSLSAEPQTPHQPSIPAPYQHVSQHVQSPTTSTNSSSVYRHAPLQPVPAQMISAAVAQKAKSVTPPDAVGVAQTRVDAVTPVMGGEAKPEEVDQLAGEGEA